jgi:hypothetical protein
MRPPKIHLQFHYGPGRVSCATRTYIAEKTLTGPSPRRARPAPRAPWLPG